MPVSMHLPFLRFVGMSALCPSPQQFKDVVVDSGKGLCGAYALMVIRPACNRLIQLDNQRFLLPRLSFSENNLMQLFVDSLDRLF